MNLRRPALLVGLGLVAVLGAACGDDDDGDSTTAAATTAAATTAEATTAEAATTAATVTEPAGGDESTTEATATSAEAASGAETTAAEATDPVTGGTTAPAATSPEQAAFIAQADQICQTAEDQITAIGEPQSQDQLPEFIGKAVVIQKTQIDALKGLQPPGGDEAYWTGVLDLLDQVHAISVELQTAAEGKASEARLQEIIDKGDAINTQLSDKADEYGFQVCGD